ncbi:hypothetical protein LWC05_03145 [Acetobacter sicerae]|uniref:Uncharacterized protein n=1 Tax=Acetobacter sicerae TaxID=85325 RepID=A0ABS8VUF0_9PROT|nr:hypothetical protein [Acetobacter sicerae]MCE0742888.1 hypothetical protein [Acetobacter sicerae]
MQIFGTPPLWGGVFLLCSDERLAVSQGFAPNLQRATLPLIPSCFADLFVCRKIKKKFLVKLFQKAQETLFLKRQAGITPAVLPGKMQTCDCHPVVRHAIA